MSCLESATLRIAVAETSPIIRMGITACLSKIQTPRMNIMEANDYSDLIECVTAKRADIAIVNPTFCGTFDPVALRRRGKEGIKIIALATVTPDQRVARLYDGHIAITDDLETINRILNDFASEEQNIDNSHASDILSEREKEIVANVVRGHTNQEIADKLFISVFTVTTHRRNIARKLDIHSATGLTIYAIVNGIVKLDEIKL